MADEKHVTLPFTDEVVGELRAGDRLLLTGVLYVARDAAHKRMVEALDRGEQLPIDIRGATIYFMGPSPARPGRPMGAGGPTTASRMDPYSPRLVALGLKAMIGKGKRSLEVRKALQEHNAVFLGGIGGAGALLSKSVVSAEVIAYEDLGPEALRRLEVKDLPVTVVDDATGRDLYEEGRAKYRREVPNA
ncbi:MAG: Fe-S-containing hydro-lyase [Dehalococcoidia bacterium]|nr:Fe-S-containing hydro-lyase [Dehalococcoidia bacterium]